MTEYLASFWNPEAVAKAKEMRESRGLHAFKDDVEFEKSILTGEYKNNKYIDAIRKLKDAESIGPIAKKRGTDGKTNLPDDLSSINYTRESFDK